MSSARHSLADNVRLLTTAKTARASYRPENVARTDLVQERSAAAMAFSRAVAREFHPQRIVLFGSYGYGKPTDNSDVDLLVIMPRTRERGERMSARIAKLSRETFRSTCSSARRLTSPGACGGATPSSASCWRRAKCYMKPTTREWVKKAENDFTQWIPLSRAQRDIARSEASPQTLPFIAG